MTFYAILGISPDADSETIRIAYRALARRYHPDMGEGSSPDKFREVVDAYETLSDRDRRRVYDLELARRRPLAVPVEPLAPAEPLRGPMPIYPAEVALYNQTVYPGAYLDRVFSELLSSLDDDLFFFGSSWRW